ncbi:MAG: SDR family oxidoreductase [Bryobacteraceae bacterium]|jgi:NAD(P)-dependent dehydrogenase (short-subunit alcohol dehydrogenase family)
MTNPLQMESKTVLVTGASSGIGQSAAILLSQLGARVILTARNQERLRETLGAMEGEGHRLAPFDLGRVEEIPLWLRQLVQETGPLDGLVCSAGISSLRPLRMVDTAHAEEVMRINYHAAVALASTFCRKEVRRPESSVVLVASVAGLLGVAARSAYSGSKGALIAFARSAAVELAPAGVRINCVAPGYVKTEMHDSAMRELSPEKMEALVRATQPLGLGKPLDVAHAIAFLLSGASRWITGSVLAVDGGYTAQ